jgi:hypothetical protein
VRDGLFRRARYPTYRRLELRSGFGDRLHLAAMTEGKPVSCLQLPIYYSGTEMENNNKDDNRILGRVLAVEEIKTVSGAIEKRPRLTTFEADTYFFSDNPQP